MSTIFVVLRGHVRQSLQDARLRNMINKLGEKFKVRVYVHTWAESEAKSSWRQLDRTNVCQVDEAMIRKYLSTDVGENVVVGKVIVDDDENVALVGPIDGKIGGIPKVAWKRMWYGQHAIVEAMREDVDICSSAVVLNVRFDIHNVAAHNITKIWNDDALCAKVADFFCTKKQAQPHPLHSLVEFYSHEKCFGVDNCYIGTYANMRWLVASFHRNLEGVVRRHPATPHQEFYVFAEAKRLYELQSNLKKLLVVSDGKGIWHQKALDYLLQIACPSAAVEWTEDVSRAREDECHFVVRAPFAPSQNSYSKPCITVSGESEYTPPPAPDTVHLCDLTTILPSAEKQAKKFHYLPYVLFAEYDPKDVRKYKNLKREHFVAYCNSNPVAIREEMYRLLHGRYPDRCHGLGRCQSTPGMRVSGVWTETCKVYSNYHFVIAMENKQAPGYVTEKIMNAYIAGAIPIYWGDDETVKRWFHPESFICVSDFPTIEACVDHICKIYKDKDALVAMMTAPVFRDGMVPPPLDFNSSLPCTAMLDIASDVASCIDLGRCKPGEKNSCNPDILKSSRNALIANIPNIRKYPLHHIFENMGYKHEPDTLWLEFGVASGTTINYFSKFTTDKVYGFDSFVGLPETWRKGFEKGAFSRKGELPSVNDNVTLIKGWFEDTLDGFLAEHDKKPISFVHVDCDLYSASKFVLDKIKDRLAPNCIVVFDELVNYDGYDGDKGELRAFHEFLEENDVEWEWIGMNGTVGMRGYVHENVALVIKKITAKAASVESTKAGISFVCRCHNEEDVLAHSLKSLVTVTRPYEIILILHRCTDNSKNIAEELTKTLPIKIFEYTKPISRAGYENLVTDATDEHSFAGYTTWCFEKASYRWKFKWDADFVATSELIHFINHDGVFERDEHTIVYLPAANTEAVNCEAYLFNCLAWYGKYVFWEIPLFHRGYNTVKIEHGVTHCSTLKIMKPYWKHIPWFMTEEDGDGAAGQSTAEELEQERTLRKELTRRYNVLVKLYGKEPEGACRANDNQCARAFALCKQQKEILEKEQIYLDK